MTRVEWLANYVLGPCMCGEAYKSRGLVAPQCSRCSDGEEVRDALLLAYQLGHDEAGSKECESVVENNREPLEFLAALLAGEGCVS